MTFNQENHKCSFVRWSPGTSARWRCGARFEFEQFKIARKGTHGKYGTNKCTVVSALIKLVQYFSEFDEELA